MRFFLDNNLSHKLASALDALEGEHGCRVKHLTQAGFRQDTKDAVWIAELERQGDWVILTKDSGRYDSQAERRAWRDCRCKVILVADSLLQQDRWELASKFIKAWPVIKETITTTEQLKFELTANAKIRPI